MPNRLLSVLGSCTTLVLAVVTLALMPAAGQQAATPQQTAAGQVGQSASQHALDVGQFPPYKPARLPDGHPDLNGYWQSLVTADWDLQDLERYKTMSGEER